MARVLPLLAAINANKPPEVLAAIQSGCGVNSTHLGESPLICAIRNGRPELVQLLLKHGADWTQRDRNMFPWSPLMLATLQCYLPAWRHRPARIAKASRTIVTILKNAGARDPEANGILGCIEDEEAIIRSIMAHGANAETEVFNADGVIVLFPKRLKRNSLGCLIPRLSLLQLAKVHRLRRLEKVLKQLALS